MANAVYPLYKQALLTELDLNKSLDQTGDNGSYCTLVDSQPGKYVYSPAHQFYTSITDAQAAPMEIMNPTVVNGVFKGDTLVFLEVTGTVVSSIVVHRKNIGASNTWRLVVYEDTGIIGFPIQANGGNIIVDWADQGIFGL
jgi:hypothetical protein